MNNFQHYIALSKYARWLPKEGRRETWEETVGRYIEFFYDRVDEFTAGDSEDLYHAIRNLEVMPSMRALMTAGKALERDHIAGYNCAGIAINHPRAFDEIFYILMNGSGVGFSVERQYTNQLPEISEDFFDSESIIKVRDSKIGWASALRELIGMLYSGRVPSWDTSGVRPAGARLKTFGGRASGPGPLEKLFEYTVILFRKARGRRLNSLECHDLVCKIADTVIVGSVRRAACISLSNLSDQRMQRAKTGQWWVGEPQRALSNNSTAYSEKPDIESFSKEFRNLYRSKSGERGIVNLEALKNKAGSCGRNDSYEGEYLLNPCGEAILRTTGQCCNLTEVVVRPTDTMDDLKDKVKHAAVLGTLQCTLTDFRYLRSVWRRNAEEERLLGISLTGIMDHPVLNGQKVKPIKMLQQLKEVAVETNKEWAKKLGINQSRQVTLVKPSGTVSQLVDSSSGIHPRMFPYYIRNIRQDVKDPLSRLMIDQGVPYVEVEGKYIFKFPMKSPEGSVTSDGMGAIQQLELWKVYRDHWCDGNPSQTIYYTDDEFFEVMSWVWKNWDSIGGLSFFPKDDHVYENAPYEKIDENRYNELLESFPKEIDWSLLGKYEIEDETTSSQEMACAGGACTF